MSSGKSLPGTSEDVHSPIRRLRAPSSPSVIAVPAVVVFLLHAIGQQPLFIDDAYIFYRYAANWADGYGPVFNPGEHVEGFSSFLWTALLALGALLSIRPENLAPPLGVLLGAASLVIVSRLARALLPETPLLWVIVPVGAALSSGLATFALTGMDTVLFTAVLLAATATAVESLESGRTVTLAISLALVVISRAEGALYALSLLAVLALLLRTGKTAFDFSAYRIALVSTLAIILLQAIARLLYFGELVPTTVLAKGYSAHALTIAIQSGFTDWGEFRHAIGPGILYEKEIIALVALPLIALVLRSRSFDRKIAAVWVIATPLIVNLFVTAWAAGDWMPLHRLNIAVMPLVLLLIAWELTNLLRDSSTGELSPSGSSRWPGSLLLIGVAVLFFGSLSLERSAVSPHISNLTGQDESGFSLYTRQAGELIRGIEPPPAVLSDVVGKLPYYSGSDVYVWDIYGLTDEHNSKHGDRWAPGVGRSDDAYNNSRPFDVLMANDPGILLRLLEFWQAHPETDAINDYVVFPSEAWLRDSFFVVARTAHPVTPALQSLCACTPITLTAEFINDQRPPWMTGHIGDPPH